MVPARQRGGGEIKFHIKADELCVLFLFGIPKVFDFYNPILWKIGNLAEHLSQKFYGGNNVSKCLSTESDIKLFCWPEKV